MRNVNLEKVRILAMLFIITHHLCINNIGLKELQTNVISDKINIYLCASLINCFVVIGVNLFFLLSGYFGIKLNFSKLIQLSLKIYILYGFGEILIYVTSRGEYVVSLEKILFCIFEYWYVIVYFVLCMISPLLKNITDYLHKKYIPYIFLCYLIVGCGLCFWTNYAIIGINDGYSLISACMLYMIGNWIHRFKHKNIMNNVLFWRISYIGFSLINFVIVAMWVYRGNGWKAWHMFMYNSPFVFLASISLFISFTAKENTQRKMDKYILNMAKHVFAVYILHSVNPFFSQFRGIFVDYCVKKYGYTEAFLVLIINVLAVFIVCVMIDCIYEKIFAKIVRVVADNITKFLKNGYKKIFCILEHI